MYTKEQNIHISFGGREEERRKKGRNKEGKEERREKQQGQHDGWLLPDNKQLTPQVAMLWCAPTAMSCEVNLLVVVKKKKRKKSIIPAPGKSKEG